MSIVFGNYGYMSVIVLLFWGTISSSADLSYKKDQTQSEFFFYK